MVAQKSDDRAKVWWSYQTLMVTITPKSDGMLPIRALTVTSDEDGFTTFLASYHDDGVCYSVLAIEIHPGCPDNQRIRFWQWKGKWRLYCPIPEQWFFVWNEVKKNKKRNICHSLFIWLFCYYLLFFYLEFTNNKCMKQMNQLASLWTLGESLLHVVNNKFLFKSKIITKRTIYLIWKIYLKSRSNIFIIQNVPFCL